MPSPGPQDSGGAVVLVTDVIEVVGEMMRRHKPAPFDSFADGWQAALDELDDWLGRKAEET